MKTILKIGLDVTVESGGDRSGLAHIVNTALQDITNRADFRAGTMPQGRVLKFSMDHEDVQVTVDLTRMLIRPEAS